MKIQEVTIFGYATKGEALVIANATVEDTCVAAINIMRGFNPAEVDVCYIVIPLDRPLVPKE
jgi:hypothetical protein